MRVLLLAGVAVLGACGPSFQAVYEGDQKFERCYALDDNPSAPIQSKSGCWKDWMQSYTYGQTRDRVEYAAMRARSLARVPSLPTDEAMMEAAPGQVSKFGNAAPAPTSAFAPPPKTMSDAEQSTGSKPTATASAQVVFVTPAAPPSALPAAECQDACTQTWQSCRKSDAAGDKSDRCGKAYGGCMRGCFK